MIKSKKDKTEIVNTISQPNLSSLGHCHHNSHITIVEI